MTVAFNSGGGILSSTPDLTSPRVNKLANSTARCWISSSGLVVYEASRACILACWAAEVVEREEILVMAVRTN